MHSAYYDASQICVTHGDLAHAVAFVELAAKTRDGEKTRSWQSGWGPRHARYRAVRNPKLEEPAHRQRFYDTSYFPNEAGVIVSRLPRLWRVTSNAEFMVHNNQHCITVYYNGSRNA